MIDPTLEDIVSLLPRARRYEDYVAGICPFHHDSAPSLLVYEDGFNCRACGKRGSLKYLYAKLQGKPFVLSLEKKQRFSWKLGAEEIWKRSLACLQKNPNLDIYLRNRGISRHTVQQLRIGYFQGWYVVPIFDDIGTFLGAIARAGGSIEENCERFSNSPGPAKIYYIYQDNRFDHPYMFLPFGIFDAISIYDCGFPAATWIAGKTVSAAALNFFRSRIIIVPDKDEEPEARRLADQLGWRGSVLLLDYPEGAKDPNDYLKLGLRKQLIRQLKGAL
jgi:DNA primase